MAGFSEVFLCIVQTDSNNRPSRRGAQARRLGLAGVSITLTVGHSGKEFESVMVSLGDLGTAWRFGEAERPRKGGEGKGSFAWFTGRYTDGQINERGHDESTSFSSSDPGTVTAPS